MADTSFKLLCQKLRREGMTLQEIMEITMRPKTSVYFHIQHIPLDTKRREKWVAISTERIITINHERKGKSKRPFRTIEIWTPDTVSLVAHLLFDGEIRNRGCIYNNRSIALIEQVKSSLKLIYDYPPITHVNEGVIRISYYNVALNTHLRTKADELLTNISVLPLELKRTFLKAFFDDEGCITFEKTKRVVRGYQHNLQILHLVQKLLQDFGIESKIQGDVEIVIGRRKNIQKFAEEINFSPGVCVNGNRSNSIWKKHLEKKEILRRALASYQK